MNYLIQKVLTAIQVSSHDDRANAITDLALILEMNTWKLSLEKRFSKYSGLIRDELIGVELDENEQAEIVNVLTSLVAASDELTGSLYQINMKMPANVGCC
jgi:hypothetical protein